MAAARYFAVSSGEDGIDVRSFTDLEVSCGEQVILVLNIEWLVVVGIAIEELLNS